MPDASKLPGAPAVETGPAEPLANQSDRRFRVALVVVPLVGIAVMALFGDLGPGEVSEGFMTMWRPVVTIASIMVITAGAGRLGLLKRVAAAFFPLGRGSTGRLFVITFVLSAGTAAILNNDSAVLLLTPIVVPLVRRLYPDDPDVIYPFVFAIFMAAGVAPLVISNPMNLIVANYAGLDFNAYLVRMLPIALSGWLVTLALLHLTFRRTLQSASPVAQVASPKSPWTRAETGSLAVLLGVLAAYPVVTQLGGPLWAVALAGALVTLLMCATNSAGSPAEIVRRDVSWDILAFLTILAVFAIGAQNAGVSDWLSRIYDKGGITTIGTISAVGSALINNHPMSLLNIAALDPAPGSEIEPILAALIGGDLGPRLLPAGSLAGLLWISTLRRLDIRVRLSQFVGVGLIVTVPSMAVSLYVLSMLG